MFGRAPRPARLGVFDSQRRQGDGEGDSKLSAHLPLPGLRLRRQRSRRFARAIETFGPQLPPEDADLPQIVRRAAARLRTARNAREAHAALAEAAKAARAHVALFRVDDPDARSDGARAATYVADTLDVAAVSLSRVSGL